MSYFSIFLLLLVVYITWIKIVRMYLKYMHFKKINMPTLGFPVPFLGNIPSLAKIDLKDQYIRGVVIELLNQMYPNYQLPKMIFGFLNCEGLIVVNDYECLAEMFVKHNKFFNKTGRIKDQLELWLGDSNIILVESNELWV